MDNLFSSQLIHTNAIVIEEKRVQQYVHDEHDEETK
jgi:hypothetical protein